MGKVIDFQKFKNCKRKHTVNTFESRNYQFETFPDSLKNKQELSLGEKMFAQDQLDKIIYHIEDEKLRSNPNDLVLQTLTDQYHLYYNALIKSEKVVPLY